MAFELERTTRLYVKNEGGACLEIRPWPEVPLNTIELHTPDEKSVEWYGKVNVTMTTDEARVLGQALIDFADEFDSLNA